MHLGQSESKLVDSNKSTQPLKEQPWIDIDQFPPDLQGALKHGVDDFIPIKLSTRCAIPSTAGQKSFDDICLCCGQTAKIQELPYCFDKKDLLFLGQALPLYMQFLQGVILMVTLLLLCYSGYALISNAVGNSCIDSQSDGYHVLAQGCCSSEECDESISEQKCYSLDRMAIDPVCEQMRSFGAETLWECCHQFCTSRYNLCITNSLQVLALSNKQFNSALRMTDNILCLVVVIIMKIYIALLRNRLAQTEQECDDELISPSDYTALIRHLPKTLYDEQELRLALQDYLKARDPSHTYPIYCRLSYDIHKVSIAFDIQLYLEDVQLKRQIDHQIRIAETSQNKDEQIMEKMKQNVAYIEEKLQEVEHQIRDGTYRRTTAMAFVTFSSQLQMRQFLKIAGMSNVMYVIAYLKHCFTSTRQQRAFFFRNKLTFVERAPEPDDILWENCGYSFKEKTMSRLITILITLILISISFFTIVGLKIAQISLNQNGVKFNQAEYNRNSSQVTFLSFVVSLIIFTINIMLTFLIKRLVNYEHHTTRTRQEIAIAQKVIVSHFINSALIIIFPNMVAGIFYGLGDEKAIDSFERKGGVIDDAFQLALINSFLMPLAQYVDVWYLHRLYMRRSIKISATTQRDQCYTTQQEANFWFSARPILLFKSYSQVVNLVWLTFFYCSLLPINTVISLAGLFIYYWLEKYLIKKRYARPFQFGSDLNKSMTDILECCPVLLALGQVWFNQLYNTGNQGSGVSYAALSISVVAAFIPLDFIYCIAIRTQSLAQSTFQDTQHAFVTDYDRMNPVTSNFAHENFLRIIRSIKYKLQKEKTIADSLAGQTIDVGSPGDARRANQDLRFRKPGRPQLRRDLMFSKQRQAMRHNSAGKQEKLTNPTSDVRRHSEKNQVQIQMSRLNPPNEANENQMSLKNRAEQTNNFQSITSPKDIFPLIQEMNHINEDSNGIQIQRDEKQEDQFANLSSDRVEQESIGVDIKQKFKSLEFPRKRTYIGINQNAQQQQQQNPELGNSRGSNPQQNIEISDGIVQFENYDQSYPHTLQQMKFSSQRLGNSSNNQHGVSIVLQDQDHVHENSYLQPKMHSLFMFNNQTQSQGFQEQAKIHSSPGVRTLPNIRQ